MPPQDPRKTQQQQQPQQRPSSPPPGARPQQREQKQEPPPRVVAVKMILARRGSESLHKLLPKGTDVDRWVTVFHNAVRVNADLVKCTDDSLLQALMHSAQTQLQPGGAYPHCYLIPYWNKDLGAYECQFQISVWGYTELVRRAGVKKVWADVVRENDLFECISGTEGKIIKHRPNWFASEEERGKIIGAYACALLPNDEIVCEPASIADIQLAKQQNRGKSPAWDLWPEQQAQKVALKRLSKYLPKGSQPSNALELDEDPSMPVVVETNGHEVPPAGAAASSTPQGALDQAVAAARAESAANANAGTGNLTIDRNKLRSMLVTMDERWAQPPHAGRIDTWDEDQALRASAYLNALMKHDGGNGILPEEPSFLKIDDASEVIT